MADQSQAPTRSRILSRATTLLGTLIVLAIAALAVHGATGFLSDQANAAVGPEPVPGTTVGVVQVERETSYELTRVFVGQVEPPRRVDVAFESGGTLSLVTVDEGDVVSAGDLIAELDTRVLQSEISALEASKSALIARADLARATAARQEALKERGFASLQRFDETRFDLAATEADIAQIDARITGLKVQIEKAEIRAPFAGQIGARLVDPGQTIASGQAVVSLFEEDTPEFHVGLPASLTEGLSADAPVTVKIQDQEFRATLRAFRPDVDPITRTRTALFELEAEAVPFGETGVLRLTTQVPADGFWIPLEALVESIEGTWSVFGVSDDNRVTRHAVELLHATGTSAFVSGGPPDGASVISTGPHRVIPGQSVALAGN